MRMVRSESADEGAVIVMEGKLDVEELDDEVEVDVDGDDMLSSSPRPQNGWLHVNAGNSLPSTQHLHLHGVHSNGIPTTPSLSPTGNSDPDRRLRRQIANCNERRRMQSINAGFQSLRALLPRKEGEKLSKAAILQQTADLIQHLQAERSRLLDERNVYGLKKRRLDNGQEEELSENPPHGLLDKMASLQNALERERNLRLIYEQQLGQMRQLHVGPPALSNPQPSAVKIEEGDDGAMTYSPPVSVPLPIPTLSAIPATGVYPTEASVSVIRPTPTTPVQTAPHEVTPSTLLPPSRVSAPVLPTTQTVSMSTVSSMASSPSTLSPTSALSGMSQTGISQTALPQSGMPLNNFGNVHSIDGATPPLVAGSIATHRSLNVILDAIRHLEGGSSFTPVAAASPPSTPTSLANLMVR